MKIILLRHGETIWNKERRLQGCQDIPLAPTGIEQIKTAGKHLAGSKLNIDLILTSPLTRAQKSAEITAHELAYPITNIIVEPLFAERSFGVCEGLTYEDALSQYPDGNYPDMETLDELFQRAAKAICQCREKYSDKTILVAAHGAIIKAILVVLTQGRIGYFDQDVWIDNGSYCLLDREDNSWKISLCNPQNNFIPHSLQ